MTRGLSAALLFLCACPAPPPSTQDSGAPCDAGMCGEACVDTRIDSQHCGACDVSCSADESCAGGRCYPKACGADPCAAWQVCVTGFCVDRECFGVECPGGQLCARGTCLSTECGTATCGPQQVCSNGACVETACVGVQCPGGALCRAGLCLIDTCGDATKNGDETDTDCGGTSCPACAVGATCALGRDCSSRACTNGVCRAATCSDGIRNQGEGDADCAGPCTSLCADGRTCAMPAQCQSGACDAGHCVTASCSDGTRNGSESDVDCGGACTTTCPDGKRCNASADCSSTLCQAARCVPGTCMNNTKDGTESDSDCGGACSGCPAGRVCAAPTDCASAVCTALRCVAPACNDTVKNGTESDVDCGGSCGPCATTKKCNGGGDCISRSCSGGVCVPATCGDGIVNGAETDADCGGGVCPRCATGRFCTLPSDCLTNNCAARCQATVILGAPTTYAFGTRSADQFWDLAVKDLDADGRPDVVGSFRPESGDGWLQVFWAQSDGGLTAVGTDAYQVPIPSASNYSQNYGVAADDLDGDGKMDLIAARTRFTGAFNNPDYCIVDWFRGAGSRAFFPMSEVVAAQTSANSSGCGNRVTTGRFNADALPDVFAADTFAPIGGLNGAGDVKGGYLAFAFDGGLATPVLFPGSGHQVAVPVDLDKDGLVDLVTASNRALKVNIFLNAPAGTFTLAGSFTAPGDSDLAVSDVDGDGRFDVVFASKQGNNVSVARATATATFLAPAAYAVTRAAGVAVADMDGDGKVDLIASGAGVSVLKGNGDGTFQTPTVYGASVGDLGPLRVGDFNQDGKPDVVAASISNGKVVLFLNIVP